MLKTNLTLSKKFKEILIENFDDIEEEVVEIIEETVEEVEPAPVQTNNTPAPSGHSNTF